MTLKRPSPPGPVVFETQDDSAPGPDLAPPVPDAETAAPHGRAMQTMALLAGRRHSRLARWFWSLLATLLGVAISAAAWNFATRLIAATPWLGWAVVVLIAAFLLVCLAIVVKEATAFARLSRVDRLHGLAQAARSEADLSRAKEHGSALLRLYSKRPDLEWQIARYRDMRDEILDAETLLILAETEILAPLDAAARAETEAAARQVATVTALVPLAFADVFAALTANIRMIRRIAEIYGGRSGTLGSLRLLRAVMTHLVATGAVAVGDDMVGSVLGGNLLSRLSRRFGEGVVNGALTARVGVAAMEVCRPMPFSAAHRPRVTTVIQRALTGLFGKEEAP